MRQDDNYWVRRSVSRRGFVGGVAIVGAGAASLGLVGCGGENEGGSSGASTATPAPNASAAAGQKKPGGVARFISADATYDTFDASRSRFTPFAVIVGLAMQRVVQWDSFAQEKLGGALAEKWESPDARTYVFSLNKESYFHDKPPVNGRRANAEDIKFHIERNKAGKTLDGKEDPNFYRRPSYQIVEKVEAVDATTVRVTLTRPSPFFLSLLAESYEGIQAPEAVRQFEPDYAKFNAAQIIGSGPYVLTEFSADGRARFRKHPKYAGTAYLDGLSYVPLFSDQAAQQAAFEQKQIDSFAPLATPVLQDLLKRFEGKVVDKPSFSANPIAGTYFGGTAPWNNPNLIGAIYKAYDRRQIIQQFHGGRGAMAGGIPPTQSAFGIEEKELVTFEGYRADRNQEIAEARRMWEAGGGPGLGDVTLDIPNILEAGTQASSVLTAMLNKNLGTTQFKAKVEPYATITSKIVQGKYGNGNANLWYGWITELTDPEPSAFLVSNFKSDSPLNRQYSVRVDGLDPVLEKLAVELDRDKRKALAKDAQRLILKSWGAGITYSHVAILNTLFHNYFKPNEIAPFSTSHLLRDAWIDTSDPTYQGRPSDAGA